MSPLLTLAGMLPTDVNFFFCSLSNMTLSFETVTGPAYLLIKLLSGKMCWMERMTLSRLEARLPEPAFHIIYKYC